MKPIWYNILAGITAVLALALLFLALFGPGYVTKIITNSIAAQIVISSNTSKGFAAWQNSSNPKNAPIYMRFYIFNVTNAGDVLYNNSKPILQELGPYSYIETKVKCNPIWSVNQTLVQFWQWEYFSFDNTTSGPGLSPTDVVTMISMPYQGVMGALGFYNWNLLKQAVVNASKVGVPFSAMQFKTDTVENIVFGLYNDTMLWVMQQNGWPQADAALQPNQTFANCTDAVNQQSDIFYQFFTGSNDTSLVHQYVQWNGSPYIGIWNGSDSVANVVQGSDAIMFGPNLNRSVPLQIFVDSLARGGDVLYSEDEELYGITTAQYGLDPKLLLNGSTYAPNYAYWAGGGPGAQPLPNGLMNQTAVQQVEIYVSKAHFLDADPYYLTLVDGLSPPNRTLHDTLLYVEPVTGVTLGTWKRIQVNTYVRPLQLQGFPNITAQYFPVLWMEEGGMITPSLAADFKSSVYTALRIRKYGPVTAFILAGLLAGLSLVLAGVGLGIIGNAHRRDGYEEVSQANYDS